MPERSTRAVAKDEMISEEHISRLCPELQAVLHKELAAGNHIVETWDCFGLGILLDRPFAERHVVGARIVFRELNDPHYWQAEYVTDDLQQYIACSFG